MIMKNNPVFNLSPLGFSIVQERLPKERLDRPRELKFQARPPVEIIEKGVRLHYYAPDCTRVEVDLRDGMPRRPMQRSCQQGYWILDIVDLPGGQYFYDVYADGILALDVRGNVIFSGRAVNFFEIPEPSFDDYLMKDVPHGTVETVYFPSGPAHKPRSMLIYKPAGYEETLTRYPVLYLQHGGGENEGGWIWSGRANFILDNLIAEKACVPMLVVMNDGVVLHEEDGLLVTDSVSHMVREDCIPYVDSHYRTLPDRRFRAAAGLSQGGMQARDIAYLNPDLFSALGMFSSGVGFEIDSCDIWGIRHDYRDLFDTPDLYASLFNLTFITCGTEDPRNAYIRPQVETLQHQGFPLEYRCYPGEHQWQVWRKSLSDMLPLLFRS